jgi:polyisoprenoid-binding protein YceI
VLLMLYLASAVPAQAAAVSYRFDPVHSQLLFFADHMGFSTSIGRFTRWQGEFSYDPDNAAANRVDVSIDIASLEMGDAAWNRTMLGSKWFAAEEFPKARFVSQRFEAIDGDRAVIFGQLTLRGRTADVSLTLQIKRQGIHPYTLKQTAGFSATTTLSRSAFGMDALKGTLADAVELRIEVEGQRQEPLKRRSRKR